MPTEQDILSKAFGPAAGAQPAAPETPNEGAGTPVVKTDEPIKASSSREYYQQQKAATEQGSEQPGSEGAAGAASEPDESTKFEEKFLSERLGGRFKSVDEINAAVEENERLKNENKELAQKATKKYSNDFVRDLDAFLGKGGKFETFMRVQEINTPAETPMDKVKRIALANVIATDALADPKESLEERIENAKFMAERKYKLAFAKKNADGDYENGEDPDDVREAQLSLKQDYLKVEKELEQYKAATLEPLTQEEVPVQQKVEQITAAWQPEIPKIVQKFNKLAFNATITPEKGSTKTMDIPIDFKVPAEVLEKIPEFVNKFIAFDPNDGAVVGEDNDLVEDQVRNFIISESLPSLINSIASTIQLNFLKADLNKGFNSSQAREEKPAGTPAPDQSRVFANILSGGKVALNK
jgi:hypothetical protein